MINEQFNKLIPYVSENFITYPLWEEGKYIPFINFWFIRDNKRKDLNWKCYNHNDYIVEVLDTENSIKQYCISPKFEDIDNGYVFNKKDWSIEEMIKIIIKLLNL